MASLLFEEAALVDYNIKVLMVFFLWGTSQIKQIFDTSIAIRLYMQQVVALTSEASLTPLPFR